MAGQRVRSRNPGRRLGLAAIAGAALAGAVGLAAIGLRDSAAFFRTPSELLEPAGAPAGAVRVGGLVREGSVNADGTALVFALADDIAEIEVRYAGPVPNLFREGQCVIAEGVMTPAGRLEADRVLAKHDEAYIPPEVAKADRLAISCGPTMNAGDAA